MRRLRKKGFVLENRLMFFAILILEVVRPLGSFWTVTVYLFELEFVGVFTTVW